MEVPFLSISQVCHLLHWTFAEVREALRTGHLVGIPTKGQSWAIVHPGIQFVDYVRDQDARMRHVAILTTSEVAKILGKSSKAVVCLRDRGTLRPACKVRHGRRYIHCYTPMEVRSYMLKKQKKDPLTREPLTSEALVAWFKRSMIAKRRGSPEEQVDREWARLMELPEPERGKKIGELLSRVEEVRARCYATGSTA